MIILSGAALPVCAQQTSLPVPLKAFVHLGLLHTKADFARMRPKVTAKEQPWLDSWHRLLANRHAQLTSTGLAWQISGDSAYADKSVAVMNA